MKFVLQHQSQLKDIATVARNGVIMLQENVDIEVQGQVEITDPIKVSGSTSFTGVDGASIKFVNKGAFSCSSNARRLSITNLALRSDMDKSIISVAPKTARTLVLHGVVVDAKVLGKSAAQNITMSQCSFLNKEMSPLELGNCVDTLTLSEIRHDSIHCLLDATKTTFDGVGLITDIYIKDEESGLLLLNDKVTTDSDKRYSIARGSFIVKNVQGIVRDLDIFRERLENGYVMPVEYALTKQYVI